ncbi:MPN313 family protein [Mycoplasmoides pneumoniae]|uniref:Uncharacterized protein MG220 homolog n=4 Tax=Mycoplasmoides pneumoniae TaxID=2104 RepID=Y313_MYCPN|nr:hypothetical protein [Mycoplasmoides pneumoniae]P75468.1 RecName: Full=Uncharacterized protein MG220 homolog [Mycoplasmoides pneumoniae M129]AAB96171.1 conserved hypothetical protein [Mycoplasmoides pneumoniae M129]AGC04232.1 hypothetical protein C985_0318 [Mycoplasmoides pneumoniae M129-B7]ALA30196.1 hypothetical protein C897_01790 [Mycoplasmoides pneumoniae PI 1428]ALA31148.1 hypothetical protein B434_03285 [Mycoplasmoides pneumoniae 19294]ALA31594.1 hypothetical protein F536_01760 [Myco
MQRLKKSEAKQVVGGLSFWSFSAGVIMIVNAFSTLINTALDISEAANANNANGNGSSYSYKRRNSQKDYFSTGRFRLGLTPGKSSYSFPV